MANPRLTLSSLSCQLRQLRLTQTRQLSSSSTTTTTPKPHHDPFTILSQPTWSIRTLLPPSPSPSTPQTCPAPQTTPITTTTSDNVDGITPPQLSHLLRLSSLPQPTTPAETTTLLTTLQAQLHFVRDIQRVNTDDIPPLASIRDETPEGMQEATITAETLQHALANEEVVGRCKRPRRRRGDSNKRGEDGVQLKEEEGGWDVLGQASERAGRYFVVRSKGNGKQQGVAEGKEGE